MILNTKQMLQAEQITQLRQKGVINEREYAYISGHLLVAETLENYAKIVIGNAQDSYRRNKAGATRMSTTMELG